MNYCVNARYSLIVLVKNKDSKMMLTPLVFGCFSVSPHLLITVQTFQIALLNCYSCLVIVKYWKWFQIFELYIG